MTINFLLLTNLAPFHRMYIKEKHDKALYDIQFANNINESIFATCGSNYISIYKCLENGPIEFLQCYQDADVSKQKKNSH